MGEQTFNISDENIEQHIVTLFEKLECLRNSSQQHQDSLAGKVPARLEVRTLSLWKAVVAECAASFLYVFIVCGAAGGAGIGASASAVLLATALASGCAIATLTLCFANISGAHVNPAVSAALCVRRRVSPLRFALYVAAQCGGAIAGAAAIYGRVSPLRFALYVAAQCGGAIAGAAAIYGILLIGHFDVHCWLPGVYCIENPKKPATYAKPVPDESVLYMVMPILRDGPDSEIG
ncbi:major intrinsic protein domain-containing protein [Phthorimaea operculella]|nr:major intrinsic protein domain-containing protein [Phthorimaea operculella]